MSAFPEEEDVSPIMKGGDAAKAAGTLLACLIIYTLTYITSSLIIINKLKYLSFIAPPPLLLPPILLLQILPITSAHMRFYIIKSKC